MGKNKRGYNWKARQNDDPSERHIVEREMEIKKIKLDLEVNTQKYDSSNLLVLPSKKKNKEKKTNQAVRKIKPLTKKEQKNLIKITEAKKKKANRAELLEKLKEVQAPQENLAQMVSLSQMQTKGLKKHFNQTERKKQISSIKSSRRKKFEDSHKPITVKDPTVVGLSEDSSEIEDSSEEEFSKEASKDLDHQDHNFSSSMECLPQNDKTDSLKSASFSNSEEIDASDVKEDTVGEKLEPSAEIKMDTKDIDQKFETSVEIKMDRNDVDQKLESSADAKMNTKDDQIQIAPVEPVERTPVVFIPVSRSPAVQKARLKLPILSEEQMIMEAINENPIVIICGETGSGKTTQVPQFLYEAGYACKGQMIGITEPRRIAAISMSERVANEMNLSSSKVSYQIRFQGNVTKKTKIKFMTDGVLLKEIQKDFLLTHYSVIIIDEAHERSVYSDILIGLLSRIITLRIKKNIPLKLIIMSATLRVEDFTENQHLFKVTPPIIKVNARQHPVTVHFNKRTDDDYVNEAYKKVCKIHRQLPEGGILIFLTGQQEVNGLCRKLKKTFPFVSGAKACLNSVKSTTETDNSHSKGNLKSLKKETKENSSEYLHSKINLNDYAVDPLDEEELQDLSNGNSDSDFDDSNTSEDETEKSNFTPSEPLYVLPLYSLLSPQRQAKVFEAVPGKARLCVVATNVAETSLTIPGIKYVVDSGKVKMRHYDKVTGISVFCIQWTSKASADQRAGRAGRTGPGHCYRLYSSAIFVDEFPQFSSPEMVRKPVDDLLLQMKALGIDNVINFPFPTPPEEESLKAAERRLIDLGALEEPYKVYSTGKERSWNSKITSLGRAMSSFPINPRYGKMLALSHQHSLLPYMIAIVASLTVQEVFIETQLSGLGDSTEELLVKEKRAKWNQIKQKWAGDGQSLALGDVMILLKAVGAFEFVGGTQLFCETHGLRTNAMNEIRKLRLQLTNEVNLAIVDLNLVVDPKMFPPSDVQCKMLRQLVLSGMFHHIAKKVSDDELAPEDKKKYKNAYKSMEVEVFVFIHPKSVLQKEAPQYVMYQEIFETSKLFMRGLCKVEPEWLPIYAPKLCKFSKPLDDPPPRYDADSDQVLCHMNSSYGPHTWLLPCLELEFPEGLDRYRWFASFLLAGKISTALFKYKGVLLASPSIMVKSWARLQSKTETMLKAIAGEKVDSRKKLFSRWQNNPKYLLSEYLEWLPEFVHYEVKEMWPPQS